MKSNEYTVRAHGIEKDIRDFISAQLNNNSIPTTFSKNATKFLGEEALCRTTENRVDLRSLPTFTIDCDTTKDCDDAVSIVEMDSGYSLGVHIADVSAYVRIGSVLDAEATNRGTSIYLPGLTVPMLPECLSNGLCSLNPDEDRYAISILIEMSKDFEVSSYSICKSLMRSKVKGTYSEVNDILLSCADTATRAKYSCVKKDIFLLKRIAEVLREKRRHRGANISSNDALIADVTDDSLTLQSANHGTAGIIIEEIMVLANALMARFFSEHTLPAIYRAQDQVKRQAYYTHNLRGHAELALSSYTHFTSPIRRLADLKNHQILSMYLEGCSSEAIRYIFTPILDELCDIATKRSRRAASVQLACQKYCVAKYFENKNMGKLSGTVCGYNTSGFPMITLTFLPIVLCLKRNLNVRIGESLTVEIRFDYNKKPYAAPCFRSVA